MATYYTANIGNGVDTVITVNHSLDSRDLVFSVTDLLTNDVVDVSVSYPTTNMAELTFNSAPSTNQYRVIFSLISTIAPTTSPTGFTLSNTTSWNETETQIVKRALRIVGAIGTGDTVPISGSGSDEYTDARLALNSMIKSLANEGQGLWKQSWITRNFTAKSEVLGADGLSYYCVKPHTSSLDDEPNVGTDWQEYWDIGGSATTAWSVGNTYTSANQFTFTNDIIDIEKIFVRDNGYDYLLNKIALSDYFEIGTKTSFTTTYPTAYAIEHKLNDSIVHMYPNPTVNSDVQIHMLVSYQYQDSTNATDNLDVRTSWLEALTYMLASRLCDEYALDLSERGYLQNKAEELKRRAMGKEARNFESSFVAPTFNYYNKY